MVCLTTQINKQHRSKFRSCNRCVFVLRTSVLCLSAVESLSGCGGGEHRPTDLPALGGLFSRYVLAARATGPAAGDTAGRCHPAGANRCHGSHHVPGAPGGPPHCFDPQQLREAAQQAEADGGRASDAAHGAAAALHLRVCGSAGAHRHHQGGPAAGASGNPQLQVRRQRLYCVCGGVSVGPQKFKGLLTANVQSWSLQ